MPETGDLASRSPVSLQVCREPEQVVPLVCSEVQLLEEAAAMQVRVRGVGLPDAYGERVAHGLVVLSASGLLPVVVVDEDVTGGAGTATTGHWAWLRQ